MRLAAVILMFICVCQTLAKQADILIVGGSLGGTAAALQSCAMAEEYGIGKIIITEYTDWLGGQATSQGVTALDENIWVGMSGRYDIAASRLYYQWSDAIRDIYRPDALRTATTTKRTGDADGALRRQDINRVNSDIFCPGNDWASRLSFLPKDGVKAIDKMLEPYIKSGLLEVIYNCEPVEVFKQDDRVTGVRFVNAGGSDFTIQAKITIDATELGDLLALSGTEYRVGIEASLDTFEPSLFDDKGEPLFDEMYPEGAQSFTYTFAIEWCDPKEDHRSPWDARPADYERLKADFSLNSYLFTRTNAYNMSLGNVWPGESFWSYRRMYDAMNFAPDMMPDLYPRYRDGKWISEFDTKTTGWAFIPGTASTNIGDIAEINWGANDYKGGTIIDVPVDVRNRRLREAKDLSMAFLYWMWYECPRDPADMTKDWRDPNNWSIDPVTGKNRGYANLKLRKDVFDTEDGMSKYPYIRESRRMLTVGRVREQDIAGATTLRAKIFHDSLAIGHYYVMDSHASTDKAQIAGRPCSQFQLPMRSMIAVRTRGLLPGCKNAGLTHLASAAYRMHPTEFQVGQAAAVMAATAVKEGAEFKDMWTAAMNPLAPEPAEKRLRKIQYELLKAATPLYWNFDAGWKESCFTAVQFACLLGIIEPAGDKFLPLEDFTRAQAVKAVYALSTAKYHGTFNTRFADVDISIDAYLAQALCFAEDIGALKWLKGRKFDADYPVTEAQFAQMLSAASSIKAKADKDIKLSRADAAELVFEYLKELYELND